MVTEKRGTKPAIDRDKGTKEFVSINKGTKRAIRTPTKQKEISLDVDINDITHIDLQIKNKLLHVSKEIPEMIKELSALRWICQSSPDTTDRILAKRNSVTLNRKIQDAESGAEYLEYILKTSDLLDEYKKLNTETFSNSFMKVIPRDKDYKEKLYRRNRIITEYMRITKHYIDLNYKSKTHQRCDSCHSTDFQYTDDDSILICQCGTIIEMLDDTPSFKDAERINMSSRYTYTCKGHFIEAMNRFEGKQNTDIDATIIKLLKDECILHGLCIKGDKGPGEGLGMLNPVTATKDHLYMFLAEKKLSDYYADINLIYFLVTGINPPDITSYRSELLDMLEQLEEAYREVKDNDRLNSLNVNWKLYKLLQLLDYKCRKDDFFCLKTPTKQEEHEEKWYDMIEYLKTKYPDTLTSKGKKRWRHIRTL